MSILLAGCRSAADKAAGYEALYDQEMAVKAYPAAAVSMRRALSYDDSQPQRWLKLAAALMAMNQPAQAYDAYQRALDLQPDSIEALQNLAVLAVRGGAWDTAKRFIDPLLLAQPTNLGGMLAAGALALHEHRYADAMKIGDSVTMNYPDRPDGLILKTRALDAQGKTAEAAALVQAQLDKPGDPSPDLMLQALQFYEKLGDANGIRATSIKLRSAFPDDPRYAVEAARAYHAEKRDDLADAALSELVQKGQRDAGAMLAVAQYWQDTLPAAAARDRIVAAAQQASPPVRLALAGLLIDLGDAARAIPLIQPLTTGAVTTANIDAHARYAHALLASGQRDAARAQVDAVLAVDDSNPEALLTRARLRLANRDYDAASTDAQRVAADDATNQEAALLAAQIYAAQGNQQLAAGAFGQARNQFPDSVPAARAEVNWLLGLRRMNEAVQHAALFAHGHTRSADAWTLYRDTCRTAGNLACQREAEAALAYKS